MADNPMMAVNHWASVRAAFPRRQIRRRVHSSSLTRSPSLTGGVLSFRPLPVVGDVNFLALGTPIRQRAIMSYVSYVGRVGASAVALGVGTAVATVPGVALAQPLDSSSSSSSSPSGSAGTLTSSSTHKSGRPSIATASSGSSGSSSTTARAARHRRIRRRRRTRAPASRRARTARKQARLHPSLRMRCRRATYRRHRQRPVPLLISRR
jgi:hypothetical protein